MIVTGLLGAFVAVVVWWLWADERRCKQRGVCPSCRGSGIDNTLELELWCPGITIECLACRGTGVHAVHVDSMVGTAGRR